MIKCKSTDHDICRDQTTVVRQKGFCSVRHNKYLLEGAFISAHKDLRHDHIMGPVIKMVVKRFKVDGYWIIK